MVRLLFFEKHIVVNLPPQSRKLINHLIDEGFDLTLGRFAFFNVDKIQSKLKEPYPDILKTFDTVDSVINFCNKNNISCVIMDHIAPLSIIKKDVELLAKLKRNRIKVIEIDNRASEVLQYCWPRDDSSHPGLNSIYKELRIGSFLKASTLDLVNKLTFGFGGQRQSYSHSKINSDFIALKGDFWKYKIIKNRIDLDPKKLLVTGSLRFDLIKELPKMPKEDLFSKLNLDPEMKTVMICPLKTNNYLNKYYNRKLFSYIKKIKDNFNFQFLLKPHPTDLLNYYLGQRNLIQTDYPLCPPDLFYQYLMHCDFVFHQFSTVGIEAAVYNIPNLYFKGFSYSYPGVGEFYNSPGMQIGETFSGIDDYNKIDRLLIKDNYEFTNFKKFFLDGITGTSHLKIANIVKKIVKDDN